MKLRSILLVLSLQAFLSAFIGSYLYYSSLKKSAFNQAERQAGSQVEMIKNNITSYLTENIKPARALGGLREIRQALLSDDPEDLARANSTLDHFQGALYAEVCYLMDMDGNTIASSNRNAPDSFVGKNFSFRPYFREAIAGIPATYLAVGTTSGKRGVYSSHPVYGQGASFPLGVVVIKASVEMIESALVMDEEEIVLVTDPHGMVFISNQEGWRFKVLWKLPPEKVIEMVTSKQFGQGPWKWAGLSVNGPKIAEDTTGKEYLVHQRELDRYEGWNVIHMRSLWAINRGITDPMIRMTGPIVFMLCILMGLSVSFLYKKARDEIIKRKKVEEALRESEARYRSIYHNTPAMLHSINADGLIVSVSDHWCEALGYKRNEVIGRKLTDFLSDDCRKYAEEVVFPEFFKSGWNKDVSYRFVKKNGEKVDALLSAIGDRDPEGRIVRSLAVTIDVTERKRAERALKRAKEELSCYSRELERQVGVRTREITSILKYTTAVIYMKDKAGRYLLVNSRYEELFKVKNDFVRGKTDFEVLPSGIMQPFTANDLRVLDENRPIQVEEKIHHDGDVHTYLSVKFPIYDEEGEITGVCSISTDVTPVKKAQDRLRRLSASIMDNQEKERAAMARELHDELGQVLTALRMDSAWLKKHLTGIDAKAEERALTMCELIDKTIQEVRGMAVRLRPVVLDDLGLVDALEWITGDFERRTEIATYFEHEDVPVIDDATATAVYRITQEAMTNVARHGGAGSVKVFLQAGEGVLNLSVTDDGCGFDTGDLNKVEGLGLAGMRERAALAGGRLTVDSAPGRGTTVSCRIPLYSGDGGDFD